MLEEQLPDYKLRVDSLYLYENADWMQPVAAHGRLPEVASPAREEDSFRYMSESGASAPNTEHKHLHTQLVLILGNGQVWKTLDRKADFRGRACGSHCSSNGWLRMFNDCLIIRLHTEVRMETSDSKKETGA